MELTERELEVLRILANVKHDPLCPKCGQRFVDPRSKEGWCVNCTARRERALEAKRRWWHTHRGSGMPDDIPADDA